MNGCETVFSKPIGKGLSWYARCLTSSGTKLVAGDLAHGFHHPPGERILADAIADQRGMERDELHHFAAHGGEVQILHAITVTA